MEKKVEGNIKVFCRFRPYNAKELANNPTKFHRTHKNTQLIIKDVQAKEVSFMFDSIFEMDSTQEEVFEKVGQPVLDNILEGFHGTIMAYGQTSSGKTHTMQGYDFNEKESRGIMPRMIVSQQIDRLFQAIEKSPESIQFKIKLSIFELYMEKVRDLLDVSKNDLKIRENKQGCYVQNITQVYVSDKYELSRIITYGQKNRITCATNMNQHSSRSHLIFLLSVNQFNNLESSSKTSKLFLIDLAGSEKISKTGAEGKVLEEAKKINLSLTNLGKVIKALSERGEKSHVPYRDSKLTRILKDSLGGNSKTTLIVTCSPHEMHLSQTISTLRFGENAQKVKNKPKINRQLTVQELQKIIEKMEAEKTEMSEKIKILEHYITGTLGAELPKYKAVKLKEKSEEIERNEERSQIQEDVESEPQNMNNSMINLSISQETEQRIKLLEEELQSSQLKLKNEMDKYYQLKKEYNELHENLTSIIKENIDLQEQLEQKKRRSLFNDKSIQDNAYLIKLIVGEIMAALGKEKQEEIVRQIANSYWYKKIMVESMPCSDYWLSEKEQINRQLQEVLNESYALEEDKSKRSNENRMLKDNQKIIELENKFDLLLEQYNEMMGLQTTWKAECQLYERKLKHKEEEIQRLEKTLGQLKEQMDQMYLYDDYDDTMSVKSNKIVKPLKGGFQFH